MQQRNPKSIEKKSVCEKVTSIKEKIFRLDGGGRKLTVQLKKEVLSWIQQRRSNILRVFRKLIMLKAKSIQAIFKTRIQRMRIRIKRMRRTWGTWRIQWTRRIRRTWWIQPIRRIKRILHIQQIWQIRQIRRIQPIRRIA